MRVRTMFFNLLCMIVLLPASPAWAADTFVVFKSDNAKFGLVTPHCKAFSVLCDKEEHKGVLTAVKNLQTDFQKVIAVRPDMVYSTDETVRVIVGSYDKSSFIRQLLKAGKLENDLLKDKNEKFIITTLHNPLKGLEGDVLLIAGSDKRGTIYGVYELSRQIGVSPWYWWADVPVTHQDAIYIKDGIYTDGEPAIQYRGIFINDEWPCMGGWTTEKFGGFNSKMYVHVYELLLRLKANFLWPAMWSAAFYADDPMNSPLADEMGIIIGTSHHEPMARNHQEYARRRQEYGPWNYQTNKENIDRFFREGIERMKGKEEVVTIAMRGDGDAPMGPDTDTRLLENIVKEQRKIISDVTEKPLLKLLSFGHFIAKYWSIMTRV